MTLCFLNTAKKHLFHLTFDIIKTQFVKHIKKQNLTDHISGLLNLCETICHNFSVSGIEILHFFGKIGIEITIL